MVDEKPAISKHHHDSRDASCEHHSQKSAQTNFFKEISKNQAKDYLAKVDQYVEQQHGNQVCWEIQLEQVERQCVKL